MSTVSDKIAEILRSVAAANEVLKGEPTSSEQLARARASHDALGEAIERLEAADRRKKWSAATRSKMSARQKSEAVAELGEVGFLNLPW
jgi:hypothetical protein